MRTSLSRPSDLWSTKIGQCPLSTCIVPPDFVRCPRAAHYCLWVTRTFCQYWSNFWYTVLVDCSDVCLSLLLFNRTVAPLKTGERGKPRMCRQTLQSPLLLYLWAKRALVRLQGIKNCNTQKSIHPILWHANTDLNAGLGIIKVGGIFDHLRNLEKYNFDHYFYLENVLVHFLVWCASFKSINMLELVKFHFTWAVH